MILPFLDSDDDMHMNLCVLLIVINTLGRTKKGVLKMNNGRLHIFLYLLKNPTVLNQMLALLGKDVINLIERDTFSITSISPNIDSLFDREALKSLISILISKKLITVVYKKDTGFFYVSNEVGVRVTSELNNNYFHEVNSLCDKLKEIISISDSDLNKSLNQTFRKESI